MSDRLGELENDLRASGQRIQLYDGGRAGVAEYAAPCGAWGLF